MPSTSTLISALAKYKCLGFNVDSLIVDLRLDAPVKQQPKQCGKGWTGTKPPGCTRAKKGKSSKATKGKVAQNPSSNSKDNSDYLQKLLPGFSQLSAPGKLKAVSNILNSIAEKDLDEERKQTQSSFTKSEKEDDKVLFEKTSLGSALHPNNIKKLSKKEGLLIVQKLLESL